MKKRILSVLLLTFLLVSLLLTTALAAQNEITVYNWGQYISDGTDDSMDVIKEFEAETGIKVNYLTFDSNESMYTKLKTGGTSYDVIIPSDYMIAKLISEDMLEPIDFANTPNYQYIDEAFRNQAYDPENKYSVPYTWGTVGLIYNTQYVSDEDAKSWSCLWNSKYAGKLLMFDNPRDAFAIAESMLGYSYNTEDAQELKNAADMLAKREHTVPDGGHGLSRCQPGACGERGLRRDGERAGHHLGREKRHRHLGRKLQSAADGV